MRSFKYTDLLPNQVSSHLYLLVIALRDHLGEEGDAGVELAVALVVGHELEHGDEVVREDERRDGLAIAAQAQYDWNCLVTKYPSDHDMWSHLKECIFSSGHKSIPS